MAMSISGAMLNGLSSSIVISRGKRSHNGGVAFMKVGRKNIVIINVPQRKKLWVPTAIKGDEDSKLDPKWLDDASQKASDYVKEKGSQVGEVSARRGQEVKDHMEKAKGFIAEKASEAMDNVAEFADIASDFVTETGKETKKESASLTEKAKDCIVEIIGEVIDIGTDISKKLAKYVGDKAIEAKKAILPPKS